MANKNDAALREHVVNVLTGGHAHATFEQAVKGLPAELQGKVPKGSEYSAWQLLEHLRIAQWDILDFSRNSKYQAQKWPDGYWPKEKAPTDEKAQNFILGRKREQKKDNDNNLYNPKRKSQSESCPTLDFCRAKNNTYSPQRKTCGQ